MKYRISLIMLLAIGLTHAQSNHCDYTRLWHKADYKNLLQIHSPAELQREKNGMLAQRNTILNKKIAAEKKVIQMYLIISVI
jgi:hypothetical protein